MTDPTAGGLLPRLALIGVLALLPAACDNDDDGGAGATDELEGTVTVFAAASLTDVFEAVGAAFEDGNPGITVTLNFAGSSALREQILAGAPADVFASASTADMDEVVAADAARGPRTFARNQLEIAVPAGNPAGVNGLADFGNGGLLIGLCAEEVPCGQYGREVLARAGVAAAIDTNEPDVRSLLTKLEAGELDAGIVYRTDVRSADDAVEGIEIPSDHNVTVSYPVAPLTEAGNADGAAAFVSFVLSDEGQAILGSFGFDVP